MNVPEPGTSFAAASRTAGEAEAVDVVSGSFGAGHDAAADEIARRLEHLGVPTRRWDVVDLMPPGLGPVLRAAYLRQLKTLPGTWGPLLDALERHDGVARLTASLVSAAAKQIERLALERPTLGFVSTHPFASQALGSLRSQGRLAVPAVTYLTDMSVHRLWVHPGIDLHLALHTLPASAARRHGAGEIVVVRPCVPPEFESRRPSSRQRGGARSSLSPLTQTPTALLVGGAYGIGRLEEAALEVGASGVATPVVLCGRNDRLRRRLARRGVLSLGWVDDVASLLASVDVVIQNAGGFTSLEALAAGVPVVTYRCIPGHGAANAAALDSAGLVPWLLDVDELPEGLVRALESGPRALPTESGLLPDAAAAIIDLMVPTHLTSRPMPA
jgi:UDP-N-acetylglucosamine:LPS N-acetylglucosamine transferase